MGALTRRQFALAGVLAAAQGCGFALAQGAAKVLIVGGGAGGATTAHLIKREAPQLDVTLIDANSIYSSSFLSNLYLGELRSLESLSHSYGGLQKLGIKVVQDLATDINPNRRTVKTKGGRTYAYDRLVLAPGIDMKYQAILGYSREAQRAMPDAYATSAFGKRLLKRYLHGLRDGGTVVLVPPNDPYSCPPAPYERACMIAHYLKAKKPRSKLVVFDPKRAITEEALFKEAFEKYYKGIVELNLTTDVDDFALLRVDARSREIVTRAGARIKADVANIIPQQRAGEIAHRAGLTEGDWCPVDFQNFASKKARHIYVVGDAASAAAMPKTASVANSQGKVVAADILADLAEKPRRPPRYTNACWSILAPEDDVKLAATYTPNDGKLETSDVFTSKPGEPAALRRQNYLESLAWYRNITADMFARRTSRNDSEDAAGAGQGG
jgi:NADPH-dependent 2,4-dienoyl-CoA reductase/sulfur reductase-like enzyme